MKNSKVIVATCVACLLAACALLSARSASTQVAVGGQKQNPAPTPTPITLGRGGAGGNRPEMVLEHKVEDLLRRIEKLEKENETFRERFSNVNARFEINSTHFNQHTHALDAKMDRIDAIEIRDQNQKRGIAKTFPLIPYLDDTRYINLRTKTPGAP